MKVKVIPVSESQIQWQINCPGCGIIHAISPLRHQFNGNIDNPTFSPSLLIKCGDGSTFCHSFVTDGKIKFLNDCEHNLAGQTIELLEIN